MRLFIAIELPKQFRTELCRIQRELKQFATGGRFVPEPNFHITLHFIGESQDLVGAVNAMHEASRGIHPFALHLGAYDCFERGRDKTAIMSVLGDLDELNALSESLESALYDNGFSRERKRYVPHITLARNITYDELSAGEIGRIKGNASVHVGGITLFESVKREKTMEYVSLHKERFE